MEPDAVEIRVLGCLIEKQRTTPDAYPLSLNALRLACNQSTNRSPVVDYDEAAIRDALQHTYRRGWTRLTSGHGSRAAKYRHLLDEALGLAPDELALLGVLMLRGAQTPGELKQRSERLHRFDDLAAVEATLARLIERGHAAQLPRQPGQKEERYAQLLGGADDAGATTAAAAAPTAAPPTPPPAPPAPLPPAAEARIGRLSATSPSCAPSCTPCAASSVRSGSRTFARRPRDSAKLSAETVRGQWLRPQDRRVADMSSPTLIIDDTIAPRWPATASPPRGRQLPWNRSIVVRNPRGEQGRILLIGETHAGRLLTVPLASTDDPRHGVLRPPTTLSLPSRPV